MLDLHQVKERLKTDQMLRRVLDLGSREENGGRVRMNGGGGLAAPSSSPQARQQECDEQDGWVPKGRISPIPG